MLARPPRLRLDPEAGGLAQLGSDSAQLRRFEESSLLRDRRLQERERIVLILYYEWGFRLKEIGDLLAVSESRVSQMLDQTLRRQKERIQASDASLEERAGQPEKPRAIPRQVQERPSLYRKANEIVERLRQEDGVGVGQEKIQEVPEDLLGTFAFNTF